MRARTVPHGQPTAGCAAALQGEEPTGDAASYPGHPLRSQEEALLPTPDLLAAPTAFCRVCPANTSSSVKFSITSSRNLSQMVPF